MSFCSGSSWCLYTVKLYPQPGQMTFPARTYAAPHIERPGSSLRTNANMALSSGYRGRLAIGLRCEGATPAAASYTAPESGRARALSGSAKPRAACRTDARGEDAHRMTVMQRSQFASIREQVTCSEYVRLLQHYVAALRRWEQAELVSKKTETSAAHLATEVKDKAQNERDAAKMRLNLHRRTCPVCLGLTNRNG